MIKHAVKRAEYEVWRVREDRWRRGEVEPFHVRAKELWERHKPETNWKGRAWEIAEMPRMSFRDFTAEEVPKCVNFERFVYERGIYRSEGLEVTRITCRGVTVEETYEYV